jgi:rRNA-processing protein FCF1
VHAALADNELRDESAVRVERERERRRGGRGCRVDLDEVIRRRVESSKNRKDLCVISSDNAVYGYARTCGVKALKCHEFNQLIREATGGKIEENRDLSVDNTKEWLRYFGEEE